jgi:hypothetical protein
MKAKAIQSGGFCFLFGFAGRQGFETGLNSFHLTIFVA